MDGELEMDGWIDGWGTLPGDGRCFVCCAEEEKKGRK